MYHDGEVQGIEELNDHKTNLGALVGEWDFIDGLLGVQWLQREIAQEKIS